MRTRADVCRLVLCASFCVQCGATVGNGGTSPTDASSVDGKDGDDGTETGADASIDADLADAPADAALVVCPAAPPQELTVCPRIGMVCEYDGGDPRSGCNLHVRCTGDGQSSPNWKNDALPPCTPIPAGMCPMTEADAKALATCSPQGFYCNYGDDTCFCTQCNGPCSPTARFICYGPPSAPGCPKKKPDIGTSCAGDAHCTYGSCASGITDRDCMGGYWVDKPVICAL